MDKLLEVLAAYQWYGIAAFVVTVFSTPLAVWVARHFGVLDIPDKGIKSHARPTPYLGGMAILAGWSVALSVALANGKLNPQVAMPVLLGGIAMSLIGLVDDIRHIHGRVRLMLTSAVTVAVVLSSGVGVEMVKSILWRLHIDVPTMIATPLSVAICVFVVLGACNSANLIDGLDGLCSGVTAIIAMGFFLLAAQLAVVYSDNPKPGEAVRLVMSLALFGAAMGFLPLNFNPAKIFMGDAGSMLLGYNCGIAILLFAQLGFVRWVIGALMIFALPIFDTLLTLLRRYRKGQSIFEGDRSHFYDQLVQRGLTVRQSVLVCYGLTAVFAAIGLTVIFLRTRYAMLAFVGVCILVALLAWQFRLTRPEEFEIERKEREAREARKAG